MATRKVTAGQVPAAGNGRPTSALHGRLVKGAALPTVSGRGRPAIPLSAEDVEVLEATRRGEGMGEFAGNLSEVQRFKGQIAKWCEAETKAGRPTKPSYRTLAGTFPNPAKGVEASESITIAYAAVNTGKVDVTK